MRWMALWALTALAATGCDDESASSGSGGGGEGAGGAGGAPASDVGTMPRRDDLGVDAGPAPRLDQGPPRDQGAGRDAGPPPADLGAPADDAAVQGGIRCDPRLFARACEPGNFCVPVPGGPVHDGRCQEGDGCRPGHDEDCPDAPRTYCHVKGGGTFCAAPGDLREGESCVDALGIPLPCRAGLVCNNSVCQVPCDVGDPPEACPDEGRCADVSEALGVAAGFCAPRGCNFFTGETCQAGSEVIGSPRGMVGPGAMHRARLDHLLTLHLRNCQFPP